MLRAVTTLNDAFVYADDHTHWPWAMIDGFDHYGLFFSGQDLRPLLQEDRDLRANGVRVFMHVQSFANINPLTTPGGPAAFYAKVGPFLDVLANYGLYAELTNGDYQMTGIDQYAHLMALMEAIGDRPCFLEGCNENEKNGADADAIARALRQHPPNIVVSLGSSLGGGPCPLPALRYAGSHLRRDLSPGMYGDTCPLYMQRGYSGYPGVGAIPVPHNEPIGAAEQDKPGSRSADTNVLFKVARMASAWNQGTFHCDDRIQSRVLRPVQRACAEAWFTGIF